ncbi:MAG: hypothetical protein ACKVPX_07110 [Myxococcaceae bacterium]
MSWSDIGHFTLDGIGMIPVAGAWADALNAVWYAFEGQYFYSALSAFGTLPLAGEVAIGTKLGAKALEHAATSGARATTRLLNPPVHVTPKGLMHTINRHTESGMSRFLNKSKFNAGEDIRQLVQAGTQQPMVRQANGRFARTFDIGRNIGIDRATGQQTRWVTIITEADGSLVTTFPGVR